MPRLLALLALATAVAAALLTTSAATGAGAASSCRNLAVPSGLRAALTNAHDRPRDGAIARGSL